MSSRVSLLLAAVGLLTACPPPDPDPPGDAGGPAEVQLAILGFTATPSSIAAGATVTLAWETAGATACALEPAPGVVPRVGTAQLMPATSTSYELRCTRADEAVSEAVFVQVTGAPIDGGPDGGRVDGGGDAGPGDGGPADAGPAVASLVGARLEPLPADLLELVSDDDALVFPEQRGLVLSEDLPCGVHVAAEFDGPDYVLGGTIPAGTRVDSFFVRAYATTTELFEADLTFTREVLCIMPTDDSLNASQPLLAAPGTTYASLHPDGGSNDGSGVDIGSPDRLSLSPDRRTVSISYTTGTTGVDDTRIVVAAPGQGPVEIRSPSAVRATATSLVEESLAANDTVFVVDEVQGVDLDGLAVDMLAPGGLHGAVVDAGAVLPTGTYDTVILHMDPVGDATNQAAATITFDRRIAGAVTFSGAFNDATDAVNSPLTFATSTAWESDSDELVVFLDERSVYLNVGTSNARVDDIRIFLEAAP